MGILIIDRQHGEKAPGTFEGGCQAIVDGRRIIETDLTTVYGRTIENAVAAAGHRVVWIDSGHYYNRHREANAIAKKAKSEKVLYLALHVNAGGGTYALSMYDAKSKGGKAAAGVLAASMAGLDGISKSKTVGCETIGWTRRAYHCIKGIWKGPANISGVLLEPFFIDSRGGAHNDYRDGRALEQLGDAIAAGVIEYLGPIKKPAKKTAKKSE